MKQQYNKQSQKQPKKQYTSGAITKLHHSQEERGTREPSKIKHYRGELIDGDKTYIFDFDSTSPIFAKIHFEGIAQEKGFEVRRVLSYQ